MKQNSICIAFLALAIIVSVVVSVVSDFAQCVRISRIETRITRLEHRVAQLEWLEVSVDPEVPPGARAVVALATNDLAARLGIHPSAVYVVEVVPVVWSDSCLGIHWTGQVCLQVLTPGFRIYLEAGGKLWEYHSDEGTRIAYFGPANQYPVAFVDFS